VDVSKLPYDCSSFLIERVEHGFLVSANHGDGAEGRIIGGFSTVDEAFKFCRNRLVPEEATPQFIYHAAERVAEIERKFADDRAARRVAAIVPPAERAAARATAVKLRGGKPSPNTKE
jgi:hypothetical protein